VGFTEGNSFFNILFIYIGIWKFIYYISNNKKSKIIDACKINYRERKYKFLYDSLKRKIIC